MTDTDKLAAEIRALLKQEQLAIDADSGTQAHHFAW
jgi:hypothetical protein